MLHTVKPFRYDHINHINLNPNIISLGNYGTHVINLFGP